MEGDGTDGKTPDANQVALRVDSDAADAAEASQGRERAGGRRRLRRSKQKKSDNTVSYFKLYRYADKWDVLLMLLGTVGAVAAGATLPAFTLIFGDIIDELGTNPDADGDSLMDAVSPLLLWFVYLGIIALVGSYAEMAFWQWSAARQTVRMRERYLSAALCSDIGYYDTSATTGGLLQGLNEEIATVQLAIGDKVGGVLHNAALFVSGFTIAFIAGWDMTLVLLAMLPVLGTMGALTAVLSGRVTRSAQKAYARAADVVTQALQNVRAVHAFNAEQYTIETYTAELKQPLRAGIAQSLIKGVTIGTTQMVAMFAYAAAMWYGQSRIVAGAYDGGQVVSTMFAAIIGGFALGQAAPQFQYILAGRSAGAKVFEVLDRRPPIRTCEPGGRALPAVQGRVELRGVHFAYPARPDVPVFQGLSLAAAAGTTVALVGPSGSGKSSVVALLQRFYDPQQGQVLLDGVDIRSLDVQWYRRQLGLVEQLPTLFAASVAVNISFGRPGASREEIEAAAAAANAHEFIAKLPLGYDTLCGERGVAFSGGQKQRIAIARAILRNPKVLLLDEATSALDTRSERLVQRALNGLMQGGKRTTVVVAHRLSTVMSADVIAVVENGQLVETGPPAELLSNPTGAFSTLVRLQRGGGAAPAAAGGDLPPGAALPRGQGGVSSDDDDDDEEEEEVVLLGPQASLHNRASNGSGAWHGSAHGSRHASIDNNARPGSQHASTDGNARPRSVFEVSNAAAATPPAHLAAMSHAPDIEAALEGSYLAERVGEHLDLSGKGGGKWWGRLRRRRRGHAGGRDAGAEVGGAQQEQLMGGKPDKPAYQEPKVKVSWRELAALNREEWWLALLGLPAAAVVGSVNPSFALTLSQLIAVFYLPVDQITDEARKWSLIFVGIGIAAFIAASVSAVCFGTMGQKLGRRVRIMLLTAVLRQDIGWFDREENSSGAIASRLSTDAVAVRGAVADQLGVVTQFVACLSFGLIIAFIAGWRMTLVLLACLPMLVLSTIVQVKFQMNLGGKSSDGFESANSQVAEAFSSIRTVTAYGMQDHVCSVYSKAVDGPRRAAAIAAQIAGIGFGLSPFILFCTYSLGFWFGVTEIQAGRMDFEQVMQVFLAIFIAAFGLAEVQVAFPDVGSAKTAVQRVYGVVQRDPPIADDPAAPEPADVRGEVELRDVHFAYPTRPGVQVFRGFSLRVPAGTSAALVGPSGGGKSTVIGLLMRFYDPQAGSVTLDGRDTRSVRLAWLRAQCGLVSQDPALFGASVRDNIKYGARGASQEEVEAAARAANAHDFISALPEGYDTMVGDLGVQLSGGQKQRVSIARAVLRNPRVLLLDEATSALDAESERVVQAALDKIMVGRTTIVIAHRLSTIRNVDSIGVVSQGVVAEAGTHEELLARPHGQYASLVAHQQGGGA